MLLGLWLGAGIALMWVTRENAQAVNRVLAQPEPGATLRIKILGKDQAALLFRYEAEEQNRYIIELWEIVQVVLSAVFFFFLLFGTTEGKFSLTLALFLMVVVLCQRFILTPEIKAVGRLLDFGAVSGLSGETARYRVMHYAYLGTEAFKWLIEMVLGGILISRSRPRSSDKSATVEFAGRAGARYDR